MRPRYLPDPTPPEQRVGSRWWDPPGELRGINLRSWLVLQLADSPGTLTVAQLVEHAGTSGLRVDGRASKTISDALRWEVRRGRAVRLSRGRYALGRLARSTKHRMRRRLRSCRSRLGPTAATAMDDSAVAGHQAAVGAVLELLASRPVVARMRNDHGIPARCGAGADDRMPP